MVTLPYQQWLLVGVHQNSFFQQHISLFHVKYFFNDFRNDGLPSITALKFDGALKMGVGTSTGHVLLYDIRSSKPLLVKDHMNEIPIKKIEFHQQMEYVYSMDSTVVKIWNKNTVSDFFIILYNIQINGTCLTTKFVLG